MQVLDTAQNILAMPIGASVRHQLHEQAQALRYGRQHVQAKVGGEIKPLPDVTQDIILRGTGKAETLREKIL